MTAFTLRQAHPADWPAVQALLQANHLPLEGAREHLSTFLLAQAGGEVVGCAGAELHDGVALLRSVAVAPGLHGQGIGRQLVSRLLEEVRRRQVTSVYLLTTTARDYFTGFGFQPVGRADTPPALQRSAEFQGACPATATALVLHLQPAEDRRSERLGGLPVAVLGAGPVGLAAAAQLVERGLPFIVIEAADRVGANLLDYGHVRLFSTWQYNIDPCVARLLQGTGWQPPHPKKLPLARDVVEQVLEPFARLPQLAGSLHLSTTVVSVTREGFDKVKSAGRDTAPFVIRARHGGQDVEFRARAVIDATGTWKTPNPAGAGGVPAIGEGEARSHIFYGIPDVLGAQRERYAGKTTLVVGAGHSAANALLSLADLARQAPGTRLVWSVRSPVLTRVFGGGSADALPARGALGTALRALRDGGGLVFHAGLRISEIRHENGKLSVRGRDAEGRPQQLDGIDEMVVATGQRPDLSLTSELRVKLDPWLESTEALGPLIDPNLHSCGTVRPHGHRELAHPEPGLYTVGVKSYGRAPTFLMATGFEQARSVVAAIAGDFEAADRVELDLPETGVCSVGGSGVEGESAGDCCGTSEPRAATPSVVTQGCGTGRATGCGTTIAATTTATPAACAPVTSVSSAMTAKVSTGCCG